MADHNTKALRELAAAANAITADVDLKLIAEGVSQAEADAVVRFHAAANPAAILALLDALEEAQGGLKHSCVIRLKKNIEALQKDAERYRKWRAIGVRAGAAPEEFDLEWDKAIEEVTQ